MNRDKILVVEDEKNICNFMKMVFENNGYQIFFAENATSGMTMYYSHHPDLVLLDLGLPDMDGVEVIKKIRTEFDTPIIVLSARSDEKDKVQALDCGANDYGSTVFRGLLLKREMSFNWRIWYSNMIPDRYGSRGKRSA